MRIVERFPHSVVEIENTWIELADGCRLAARIWLPATASQQPVPAILEYIPYRKRDGTRDRDEPMHRYFAGHGYAAVRVDLRGSGDSDGTLLDEYLEVELSDGLQVIAWIAAQPWCSGAVGMMGKSWGGFNALQVAALQPPQLKAILTVCSTDDRYTDDAHYMGGCLLNENLLWGSMLFTLNAMPPDPIIVGARWRELWFERLEYNRPFPAVWMRHPYRDAYWRHGSVCEDYARIRCPVYAVGGWADGYSNAVPRLMAGLQCPRKGLIGPWAHVYPHVGVPGPAIGFLQEALRWWDQWLRGIDTGILDEPMLRVWMQEAAPTGTTEVRGRWVAVPQWPDPGIDCQAWTMAPGQLNRNTPAAAHSVRVDSPSSVGSAAGAWCAFGFVGESPGEQGPDDARSCCFDSKPLADGLEILGAPILQLALESNKPRALLAVRLNEVTPDGQSLRVTYGLLDLAHRGGHAAPEPLEPGKRYQVRLRLNDVAHAFKPGNRLRVAISTSYWPLAWPSPERATLVLFLEDSLLELPRRPAREADWDLLPFGEPEAAAPLTPDDAVPGDSTRRVEQEGDTHRSISRWGWSEDGPLIWRVPAIDLECAHGFEERYQVNDRDPSTASAAIEHRVLSRRGAWETRIETRMRLDANAERFRLRATLEAFEGTTPVFSRRWHERIPRLPRP